MASDAIFSPYLDEPVFNIKAVTQRTGISAPTLRAWERRYNVLSPSRSNGNYRLFSERDVAVLNWLNDHLKLGMSISRAVALLNSSAPKTVHNNLPENIVYSPVASIPLTQGLNFEHLQTLLHRALINMDEPNANAIFAEALAVYPIEAICQHIITPVFVQIGQDWHDGLISVTVEHFATALLLGKFYVLFQALSSNTGPLIIVSCAPGEHHEIGALMVSLLLRRRGHNVRYLGANMPIDDLVMSARKFQPRAIVLSLMMTESLRAISQLPERLQEYAPGTYLFIGGSVFHNQTSPQITANELVRYIGSDLHNGLAQIESVL